MNLFEVVLVIGVKLLSRNDFRSSVVGRTTRCREIFTIVHDIAEPKISNLDVIIVIDEDILQLQVAMCHQIPVAVIDACHDLLEISLGFLFWQLAFGSDHIVEVTT